MENISDKCRILAERIDANREIIIESLLKYESYETAIDELWRSLDCLYNVKKELVYLSTGKVQSICTFFPVNLPLYSLVIFAIIPGFMTEKMFVRPSVLMRPIVEILYNILHIETILPGLLFINMERNLFCDAYVSSAEVILFTGRYENALTVLNISPNSLFIYNGAGINPVVVTKTADLDFATDKIVEMRTFNSGQDCAGSDAILVHEDCLSDFLKKLIKKLKYINVGQYNDRLAKIGPLVKNDQLKILQNFFDKHKKKICYGGKIEWKQNIIYPTVIVESLYHIETIDYTEFFAPIFYILSYRDKRDLSLYFTSQEYLDHAMYVSLFSHKNSVLNFKKSIILHNKIINDIERGNDPYGGYGPKANFVYKNGKYINHPILISREISDYLKSYSLFFVNE